MQIWVLYFKRILLMLNLYLNIHFSNNIRLPLAWDFGIVLYISFLSRPLSLWYATLYQSSILNSFIVSDYNWGSNGRVLKSDKTDIFYKLVMKDVMCNVFGLVRACVYVICLDLHK